MKFFQKLTCFRWGFMWIFFTLIFSLTIPFLTSYTGKDSYLGDEFSSRFVAMLLLSAPWFLWGETISRYIKEQNNFKPAKRVISILAIALMPVVFIFITGLLLMDLQ